MNDTGLVTHGSGVKIFRVEHNGISGFSFEIPTIEGSTVAWVSEVSGEQLANYILSRRTVSEDKIGGDYLDMIVDVTDRANYAIEKLDAIIDNPRVSIPKQAEYLEIRNTIELQKYLVTKLGHQVGRLPQADNQKEKNVGSPD